MSERGTDGRRRMETFDVDMAELVDGYQFDGRARALAQWRERKEQREFEALCKRLAGAKRRREIRSEGGDRLRRLREARVRWRARNREAELAAELERKRKRRRDAFKSKVCTCAAPRCEAQWSTIFGRGNLPKYCSDRCKYRAYRAAHRTSTVRCRRCGERGHNARACTAEKAPAE